MNTKMARRDFIKTVPVAAWAVSQAAKSFAVETRPGAAKLAIETFDYDGGDAEAQSLLLRVTNKTG